MPKEQVAQLGAGQALMHLASDAVRAAATSPFLEASGQVHGLPVAILCSLALPVPPCLSAGQQQGGGVSRAAALPDERTSGACPHPTCSCPLRSPTAGQGTCSLPSP